MINKILRSVGRWCYRHSHPPKITDDYAVNVRAEHTLISMHNSISFLIHFAQGGTVVEISMYDQKTDTVDKRLYVVTEDNDLGKELNQIIMVARLQHG